MATFPSRSAVAAFLRHWTPRTVGALAVDVLLPAAGYTALVIVYNGVLVRELGRLLATSRITLTPNDLNGTVWLYWWIHGALTSDAVLQQPDLSCWPSGEPLGTNFPNVVDALIAAPFLELFGFPAGFNAFVLAIPVLGALAGYLGFRTLTRHRALAWCAGAFLGFNAYTVFEIRMGRPATGLIVVLPLFLAAWTLALRVRGNRAWWWIAAAGLIAALAAYHYLPFALWIGLFAISTAAGRSIFPPRGMTRSRSVLALAVVGVTCLALSLPYLARTRGVQLRSEDHAPGVTHGTAWDGQGGSGLGRLWRDLWGDPSAPGGGQHHRETQERLQRNALPVDFLWRERDLHDRELELSVALPLLLFTLLIGLVSGRRGRGWLACTLLFWALTLGPFVSQQVGHQLAPVTLGETRIATPMWFLARVVPLAGHFLWPFRAAPMFLLCLVGTLVVATDVVVGRLSRSADHPRGLLRRAAPPLILLVAMACCILGLDQNRRRSMLSIDHTPWAPHPFLVELGSAPDEGLVIDLPLGLGEGTAIYQVVHRQPRIEGLRGELIQHRGDSPPAFRSCLAEPFLQALWFTGRGGPVADQAKIEGFTPPAILAATRGRRTHILLHPMAYGALRRDGIVVDPGQVALTLETLLGPPVVEDPTLIVFEIPASSEGEPVDPGVDGDGGGEAEP